MQITDFSRPHCVMFTNKIAFVAALKRYDALRRIGRKRLPEQTGKRRKIIRTLRSGGKTQKICEKTFVFLHFSINSLLQGREKDSII